ncbi:MAG: glycoside hydrolase family 11 protein [Cellvibrionaceae bacterium]|nr:glycoside hydrolase family 11 protein [Cellvibrionaceae bacterium]
MIQLYRDSIFHLKLKLAYFSNKAILSSALLALFGSSAIAQDANRDIRTNESGTHNGFYYNLWLAQAAGAEDLTFGLREAGRYTAQWTDNVLWWAGGIGWNPSNPSKALQYSGTFNPDASSDQQNAFLALYGTANTRSRRTEFFIVETYGAHNPSACNSRWLSGSFQSDGATYDIVGCYLSTLANPTPSYQVFSVRNPKKNLGRYQRHDYGCQPFCRLGSQRVGIRRL